MDLALAGILCLISALLAKKYNFPAIPAYILAGIIFGSSGLGILSGDEVSEKIAELGVVFLLFYIGLHISPGEIKAKKREISISGIYDFAVNFFLVFLVLSASGMDLQKAFVLSSALYISSSAIVLQSLIENRKLIFREAETVVWMMVFEDIVIAVLIILNSLSASHLIFLILKLAIITTLILYLSRILPKYLIKVLERDDEIPVLLIFSSALLSLAFEEFFQIPYAYAAILLGTLFSQIKGVEERIIPFKEIFLILFFFFFGVSVEFDSSALTLGILLTIIAISGKVTSGMITGLRISGSIKSGLEIGFDTIARGEFSIYMAFAFGDDMIASAITIVVLITSILGSFTSKFSAKLTSKAIRILERLKFSSIQ